MTATTAADAQTLAPTAKQVERITDLAAELGLEIQMPRTRKTASRLMFKLIHQADEKHGDKKPPTSAQVRLLEKLGAERGRDYQVPATRKQASARIAQILAAGPTTQKDGEVPAAA
jgi:predicted phage tail protein